MKKYLQKLSISDIVLEANHGVYDFEKNGSSTFKVSVKVHADFSKAMTSDCLQDTVDYQKIYKIVCDEMAIHSDLIEHVAKRMAARIQMEYDFLDCIELTVYKLNPPLGGEVAYTSFEIIV